MALKNYIEWYLFLKNLNNWLAIGTRMDYCITIQQRPRLQLAGWFLSEGTIHLSEWHPPVCDVENFKKGECHS
jgi:hypothetical protein